MTIQLFQGDALEFLRKIPDRTVDAIITDPPYSSGGAFRGDRAAATTTKYVNTDTQTVRPDFAGDNRDQRSYLLWCALWLGECLRIARPGAPIALFTDWRQLPVTTDALQVGGWVWRGIVPWNKTEAARPTRGRFRAQCEYVVWGSAGPMQGAGEDAECMPGFFTYVVKPSEKRHIAGKPVGLMVDILKIVKPGGLVLDPFMGGGSTGEACLLTGREFIGIELDPVIFHDTARELQTAQQKPVLPMFSQPVQQGLEL